MIDDGRKLIKLAFAKLASWFGFCGFYKKLNPEMRLGNQPDMPTITTDRLWFLRENRFLFFTRDGPVEVTLKPSFVLTGILVCMAGVTAIFYYTLIASYSAIEVMRDETIKTAEANIGKEQAEVNSDNMITWQSYQSSAPHRHLSLEIDGKRPQPSKSIVSRIRDKPSVFAPQIPQNDGDLASDNSENLPLIIQGGKRVTLVNEKEMGHSTTPIGATSLEKLATDTAEESFSGEKDMVSSSLLADTSNDQTSAIQDLDTASNTRADVQPEAAITVRRETNAELSPVTPSALAQTTTKSDTKASSFSTRAQELAVALLPNFAPKQKVDTPKTEGLKKKNDQPPSPLLAKLMPPPLSKKLYKKDPAAADMAPINPDDGLSTDKTNTPSKSVLPIVSEAARTRKLFLALKQEIDYIRSTVSSLGISQEALPAPLLLKNQANEKTTDREFRTLMIKLAEHRAALRKIPFKPPMLYFYISSDYGMRKHPKTGKKAFHHGVDLAGTWQENVRATAPGTVIYAGTEGSFGKVVRVQHEFGIVTTYAHLARITVRRGDYVGENHVVGKMGNTGKSAGMHLHYEIRVNGKSIDPNKFMKVGRQLSVAGELRQSSLIE